jgi:hypothetical protein
MSAIGALIIGLGLDAELKRPADLVAVAMRKNGDT